MMQNKGQIFATDDDKRRLAPIHDRLKRSGARNVQVRTPKSVGGEIADLAGRMDLVLIDAPCTGTGAWRRNPDAKWRIRPGALEQRVKEQVEILDRAVPLLKPGGRIGYVTCSVLDEENGVQVQGFLARHPGFTVQPPAEVAQALGARPTPTAFSSRSSGTAVKSAGGRLVIKRKRNSSIAPQSGPNLSAMIACLWNPESL
jgi:16S rRNA (cytosine967-C5)-methyltransferase